MINSKMCWGNVNLDNLAWDAKSRVDIQNTKTGTRICKDLEYCHDDLGHRVGDPIYSKTIEYGDNTRLNRLGIDKVEIFKRRGQEPVVRFSSYEPDSSITFLKKTNKSEMKEFLSILKDMKENGVKASWDTIGVMLKRIVR